MTGRIVISMLLLSLALVSCGDGTSDSGQDPCPIPQTRVEDNDCTTASVAAAVCSKYCFDSLRHQLGTGLPQDITDAARKWLNDVERPFEDALVRHHDEFCESQTASSDDVFQIADLDNLPAPFAALGGYVWYNISVIIHGDGTVGCNASSVLQTQENMDPATRVGSYALVRGPGGYHACD